MALIRRFEERLLELFEGGELVGTTHCYIGQEADAVGVINHLQAGDVVFSNHRCHGHFLTWADRPELLMAELMGRADGVVGGRGGSQHICHEGFYSNGVLGGTVPAAVGLALASRLGGRDGIGVAFLGDGTLGEGVVYEALNMASLWSVPILFVVENNRWAQSTPIEKELAGDMVARGRAFGIDSGEIESTDAEELYRHFAPIVDRIRDSGRPHLEVIHTYRLCHHSKSDDRRPPEEVERYRAGDPLPLLRARLPPETAASLEAEATRRVEAALEWSRARPLAAVETPAAPETSASSAPLASSETRAGDDESCEPSSPSGSDTQEGHALVRSLNRSLHSMLADDPRVMVLGEDLLDPYGGAFKVTRGLSTDFPERVLTTPISEAGFVGVAGGLALAGLRPVVEIMFGDFLLLAADQLLNYVGKYQWMYNDQATCPLVVRAPMGGRRGYGPTHSQTTEKHLVGIPGLAVVAPSPFHDAGALLRQAVLDDDRPVLFVENKSMYPRPLRLPDAEGRVGDFYARTATGRYPTVTLSHVPFDSAEVTLVAYGGMAELAAAAAERALMEHELLCELVVPSSLNPLDLTPVLDSLGRSGRLVVCEESSPVASWGSELISRVSSEAFALLSEAPIKVAAWDLPIGNSPPLEEATLPQVDDILRALLRAARRSSSHSLSLVHP